MVKNPPTSAGDTGSILGSGRFPGEGNGYLLQYSCLENPMDRGAWWATVHGVAKSQTQLSDFHFHMFTAGFFTVGKPKSIQPSPASWPRIPSAGKAFSSSFQPWNPTHLCVLSFYGLEFPHSHDPLLCKGTEYKHACSLSYILQWGRVLTPLQEVFTDH